MQKEGEPSNCCLGQNLGGKHCRIARRVAGAAAGGVRRNWRRGQGQRVLCVPCRAGFTWSTCCATEKLSLEGVVIRTGGMLARTSVCLPLAAQMQLTNELFLYE